MVPPSEQWEKSQTHINKLQEEGKFFNSLLPELHRLTQPSLLIIGLFDPVCSVEQQEAYRQQVPNHSIVSFDRSAHFPRLEEPARYKQEILSFIKQE